MIPTGGVEVVDCGAVVGWVAPLTGDPLGFTWGSWIPAGGGWRLQSRTRCEYAARDNVVGAHRAELHYRRLMASRGKK